MDFRRQLEIPADSVVACQALAETRLGERKRHHARNGLEKAGVDGLRIAANQNEDPQRRILFHERRAGHRFRSGPLQIVQALRPALPQATVEKVAGGAAPQIRKGRKSIGGVAVEPGAPRQEEGCAAGAAQMCQVF